MRKQIVLIRWWEVKENHKDYYEYLEKQEYDPYRESTKRWNRNLQETLWDNNFEVFSLSMPNRHFADYKAWKIVFEKVFPYLKDKVIFIWHSLWWWFLLKYFNEEADKLLLDKVEKIILVAPAVKDILGDLIWTFKFDLNLNKVKKLEDKIIIFSSKDDPVVPFSHTEDIQKSLSKSEYKIFENKWHFLQEEFPELIDYLNSLNNK